jgi:DNA transposition AAA+ family ATPase
LQKYAQDHNHGQTRYLRLSACGGAQLFLKDCASACALSRKSCFEHLRERVFGATDENTLWIFDEIHQTFVSYHQHARLACLELIRELQDRTGCGIVLAGTAIARDEIEAGAHSKMLEQLNRRGIFKLQLPHFATVADTDAIARHYGLPPAEGKAAELVEQLVRHSGLKAYTTYLRAAGKIASNKKAKVTWDLFIQAHDTIARMSEGGGG